MKLTRRNILTSTLFGAGYVGLRALATGIPASVLLGGRDALAEAAATCTDPAKAQFIVFGTSGQGDPMNANAPGTYDDARIVHNLNVGMEKSMLTLGGKPTFAARPWTTLPQAVLDRTCFWHIMTNTPVHPKQPDVLKLAATTSPDEMLPSLLARQLAACLGTLQAQPITVGARSPSEGLSYGNRALPIVPPLALKETLLSADGPLTRLQPLRDQTLSQIDAIYRGGASAAQKRYLDSLIASQGEIRNISQNLLNLLDSIVDNGVGSQITAALALIQMKVTPVVAIHIPFGGDNHSDPGLVREAADTIAGVASIASLMSQLGAAGLADKVSFMTLNVFGRTLGAGNTDGRNHNENHQLSIAIGKPWKGGIIGGVAPVAKDYGAQPIDSATGAAAPGGDISPIETLAAFGKTTLAAVGVDSAVIDKAITAGKVVRGALV
jgi:hypothetical protein